MAERSWSSPRVAAAVCAALIVLGAAVLLLPPLLARHTATSGTPIRRDLVAHDLTLAAGQRACLDAVALDRDSAVVRVWVRRVAATGTTLGVTAAGTGYHGAGTAPLVAGAGSDDGAATDVRLTPAPPHTLVGTLCVANAGRGTLTLAGTDHPRALVRSHPTRDGAPLTYAFSVSLLQAHERSPLARAGELVDRAAALTPFGPWLFWLLLPLLLALLPALVVASLYRALVADAEPPARS